MGPQAQENPVTEKKPAKKFEERVRKKEEVKRKRPVASLLVCFKEGVCSGSV